MSDLDALVTQVQASKKYKYVTRAFIERIGAAELDKARLKDAVKATKNKLHQTGTAYHKGKIDYAHYVSAFESVAYGTEQWLELCKATMRDHASTNERLPIVETFFTESLASIAPLESVLDLACGLNPLASGWMPLADDATYHAYDIFEDMMSFLNTALKHAPFAFTASGADIGGDLPPQPAQVALILKTLPCLEQVDKSISLRLLETVNAEHMLVSYPVATLGGRKVDMRENYDARLRELVHDKAWNVQRFDFETELAYLISK